MPVGDDRLPGAGRRGAAILLAAGCLGFGVYAVALGKGNGFDVRNYHYYVVHALFGHRLAFDYAPAQAQSYLNPLSFVPFYLMAKHLPAVVTGFVLGAVHGSTLALVFLVARRVLVSGTAAAVAAAVAGVLGPNLLGMAGTSQNDPLIGILVLASCLGIARWLEGSHRPLSRLLLASGVVLGAAVGLKMTAGLYALAATVALVVAVLGGWRARLGAVAAFAAALAVGFLVTNGYWMVLMGQRFGNPLFPFFNRFFASPYLDATNAWDSRFLPKSIPEALAYPVLLATRWGHEAASGFRDARYGVVYVLALVALGAWLVRRRRAPLGPVPRFLVVFFAVSYVLWQTLFAIARYAVALEALAPTVALVLVGQTFGGRPRIGVAALGVILMVACSRPAPEPRIPWGGKYFDVTMPRFRDPSRVLVVTAQNRPWSYMLTALQPEVRVLGLASNLTKPHSPTLFQAEMRAVLDRHAGDIYVLGESGNITASLQIVDRFYGLAPVDRPCLEVETRHETDVVYLCPVQKAAPSAPPP